MLLLHHHLRINPAIQITMLINRWGNISSKKLCDLTRFLQEMVSARLRAWHHVPHCLSNQFISKGPASGKSKVWQRKGWLEEEQPPIFCLWSQPTSRNPLDPHTQKCGLSSSGSSYQLGACGKCWVPGPVLPNHFTRSQAIRKHTKVWEALRQTLHPLG